MTTTSVVSSNASSTAASPLPGNIQDPFFRASALQSVILLLDRAELESERDELLAEVDDDLMRQRIADELASGAEV